MNWFFVFYELSFWSHLSQRYIFHHQTSLLNVPIWCVHSILKFCQIFFFTMGALKWLMIIMINTHKACKTRNIGEGFVTLRTKKIFGFIEFGMSFIDMNSSFFFSDRYFFTNGKFSAMRACRLKKRVYIFSMK